jgi:RNA 2',3'-cyclic 3'-phosphodiesterase
MDLGRNRGACWGMPDPEAVGAAVRSFVALHPSPAQRDAVQVLTERLVRAHGTRAPSGAPARARGAVRWVPAHQAHITLAFLGSVEPRRLGEVGDRVADVAVSLRPFELAFAGVGAFPDARRPRVIWLGVSTGRDAVTDLALAVREALAPLGFEGDHTPYRPHLTLGRIRRGATAADRSALSALLASTPADVGTAAASVREVTLMASRVGPEGAAHAVLRRAPLGEGPRGALVDSEP